MKKNYLVFSGLVFAVLYFSFGFDSGVESRDRNDAEASFVSPNIVISQIYGGGGNAAGSPYSNDFVELFNRSASPVNLNGWSIQYASAGGTEWLVNSLPDATLQPGQYFLIQFASGGSNGAPLPSPDFIAPPITNNAGNTFTLNLSATTGKLALVNSTAQLPAATCPGEPSIVDLVGFGGNASCFEGAKTANLSATTALFRNGGGCTDSDNNANDFTIGAPAPRNTGSPVNSCNLGGVLQASGAASPSLVTPGSTTLLTVKVVPAATPPSTEITVVGNLASISGSANQQFFDDGTGGDAAPNDNIFSYLAMIPANMGGGQTSVAATASDAQGRNANVTINLTVNAQPAGDNPLLLGNPSNATGDTADENNYLMIKPQYSLSYNRSKATANWVAWRLDASWIGSAQRQDDFRPDPDLPALWYQVLDSDYSGSGYQRGHMTPSGDRTRTAADNSATFLMTNIVPQIGANNEGPWADFENYCRELANQGKELYIIAGVFGNAGTIAQGRIVVPQATWKVVLVLPNGDHDLQRISKSTRTIAIIVPNQLPLNQSSPWREFRKTVDQVEFLTGHNFFSAVPKIVQESIERKRDRE